MVSAIFIYPDSTSLISVLLHSIIQNKLKNGRRIILGINQNQAEFSVDPPYNTSFITLINRNNLYNANHALVIHCQMDNV